MLYKYNNIIIKVRTYNELLHKLEKTYLVSERENQYPETTKYLEQDNNLSLISPNKELVYFLNSPFNIPTLNNFANRSAISLCERLPPSEHYKPDLIPSFAEYLISLFKVMVRYRSYEYIRNNWQKISPFPTGQLITINDYFIDTAPVIEGISKSIRIEENMVLRYSKAAKWCDEITSGNINSFLLRKGVIYSPKRLFDDQIISELDLLDKIFLYKTIKEVLPKSNLEWLVYS
jgi:hypothetical protein